MVPNMKKFLLLLLVFVLACVALVVILQSLRPRVQVVDQNGRPIAGAEVIAVSLSMNAGGAFTDDNGIAVVPRDIQGTQWIEVRKQGYDGAFVAVPSSWPLRVTLMPGPSPWLQFLPVQSTGPVLIVPPNP
jgi:hypothetical protein